MEASPAIRDASQPSLLQTLKARVVTTAVGFRIGPLGVDYSSRKVEFDPQAAGQDGQAADGWSGASPSAARQAYAQAKARYEAASGQAAGTSPAAASADPLLRKGLAAYAKAQSALSDTGPTLVAVA